MIKNLKIILNYDTRTWWLPGSPRTHNRMESMPHSLPKPIIENTTSDRKKATKTSKENSNGISENEMISKIQKNLNGRIKTGTKRRENNNKESKPKFGAKIKLKSGRENDKTMLGKN